MLSFLGLVCFCATVADALLVPGILDQTGSRSVPNVHHIFNAIHPSLRQWGSSRNHNGMSFFLAKVPQGTQFYHGTSTPLPVTVMEWLAFEPEHAINFAFAFDPPPKRPKNAGDDVSNEVFPERQGANWLLGRSVLDSLHSRSAQQLLGKGDTRPHPPPNLRPGWLHTYQAKQDLNLLYIDAMSAAKCWKGTLDTQDYLLLMNAPPGHVFDDRKRGLDLCALARDRWSGRINGFIRMEHGFEIIMYSFIESLDLVRVTRVRPFNKDHEGWPLDTEEDAFSFYQAITARYHSIGGNRVTLNFDRFVSVFAYNDLDLFASHEALPRLRNVSKAALAPVVADIDRMILEADPPRLLDGSPRWQSVADEIVARYANRLQTLASGKFSNLTDFKLEIWHLLRPFIDFDDRDEAAEVDRCTLQFIPPAPFTDYHRTSFGRRIVRQISQEICATLYSMTKMQDVESAISGVKALMKRLNWTVWQECRGCAANEICHTPIWPHGSVAEYKNPHCVNSTGFLNSAGDNYWFDTPP